MIWSGGVVVAVIDPFMDKERTYLHHLVVVVNIVGLDTKTITGPVGIVVRTEKRALALPSFDVSIHSCHTSHLQ